MTPDDVVAREEIRRLVADYACGVDRGRFADVAALFSDDGVLELPDGRRARGHTEIMRLFGDAAGSLRAATSAPVVRHHVTTHHIAFEGLDSARGTAYFVVFTGRGLDHWGTYRDRYIRLDDAWRFSSRTVHLDGRATPPWSAG